MLPHDPSPECLQVQTRTARRACRPRGHRALRAHVISDMDIDWAKRSLRDPIFLAARMSAVLAFMTNECFSFNFLLQKNTKRIDSWDLPLSETQLFLCQRLEWYMARWDSQFLKNTEQYNRVRFTPFRGPQCRRLKSSIMDSYSHFWCSHVNNFFLPKK